MLPDITDILCALDNDYLTEDICEILYVSECCSGGVPGGFSEGIGLILCVSDNMTSEIRRI